MCDHSLEVEWYSTGVWRAAALPMAHGHIVSVGSRQGPSS